MGKKQHQQDKLYLTSTEWKNYYGGKKDDAGVSSKDSSDFKRLPFYCCSLTFHPCKHPYCSPDGIIFDLENIVPFIKKYGKNPVTGQPLEFKQLIKLNLFKNAKEEYHCPVTYKVFNENSFIVAIKPTGNVFSNEAIEELNIKANYYKDLLSDEPFTKKDIIKLQDPNSLDKFNLQNFHHIKLNLKWEEEDESAKKDPTYYLKTLNTETKNTLEELKKSFPASTASSSDASKVVEKKADSVNAATYSTGRAAASLTSTVMDICTKLEPAIIDENQIRWSRVIAKGKKGYVCLVTNLGRLNVELFCDQVPKTCENFLKHCANKYYKDTKFHRSIKNFMIQGGDPTATGTGGESIWGKPFEDEFKPNLSHNGRGILSMANSGPNTNKAQFFITFRSCPHLDKVHTVFGKIVGGLDVVSKMEAVPTDKKNKPKEDIVIEDCLVFVDPYVEVDEEIKQEREKEKQKKDGSFAKQKEEENAKKNALADLKPQRSGVGKYITSALFETEKRNKQDEDEIASKAKKQKTAAKPYGFGDFSNW